MNQIDDSFIMPIQTKEPKMINRTDIISVQPKLMLKVKTHLKAGQGVCAAPDKAYRDGYDAGYNDSRNKGPKHGGHNNDEWWW